MQTPEKPKSIVVISSHVARGSVGNRAAVFALEALGFPVWAVPTVTLPWHPGHGRATRIVPDDQAFDEFLDDLAGSKFISEVGAILSGYMGSESQAKSVARFVEKAKQQSPNIFYVCDPVMGDESGLYIPKATAQAMKAHLLPVADLITPNRFELEWLTGETFSSNEAMLASVQNNGFGPAIITSALAMLKGGTGNLYTDGTQAWLAEHRAVDDAPNGTGDLLAALFLARLQSGLSCDAALRLSTQSVFELLARTTSRGADELTLEMDMASLRKPASMVQMRSLSPNMPKRPA